MKSQSWSDRAMRRGAGAVFFRPPEANMRDRIWHMVDTHQGLKRVQWRPGIDVWHGVDGERWTAETAYDLNWRWVAVAMDQSGGRP